MTSNIIYIRLHGTMGQYNGSYPDQLLKKIIKFIQHKSVKQILIYFNNTDSNNAWSDANKLKKNLT